MGLGRHFAGHRNGHHRRAGVIYTIKVASAIGFGDEARRFSILSFSSLAVLALFVTLAIANVRNSEVHKRWMLLAMVPLLHAAMGRVFQDRLRARRCQGTAAGFRDHSIRAARRPAVRRGDGL